MGYFPTYLYFHPSSYIFRIRVPCDIIPFLGKMEIRRSVKTHTRIIAIQRGIRMFALIQSFFKELRRGSYMTELSKAEINLLLDEWFKQALEDDETERIVRRPKNEDDQMIFPLIYSEMLREVDSDLTYGYYSKVSE